MYKIKAEALEKTGAIIPEEPMSVPQQFKKLLTDTIVAVLFRYLLFNTAVSATWGFPQCPEGCDCECLDPRKDECSCALPPKMAQNFPATMQIDYVRVYQAIGDDDQIIGCSTPSHPSKKFIEVSLVRVNCQLVRNTILFRVIKKYTSQQRIRSHFRRYHTVAVFVKWTKLS